MTIRLSRFILFSFSLLLVISSCSKINEATDLGDETIPEIDGVHTFDTTMLVETYDTIFDPTKDSIRVGRTDDHILGNIVSDPIFGKTNAKIFVELKPEFYPWNFSGVYKKDSLYIDSIVMVLGWNATYGDTTAPQRVRVWELDPSNDFKIDTFGNKFMLREQYFTYGSNLLLGTKDFFPYQLNDSVYSFQDTTAGQLRIKLNNSFGRRLLDYDTTNAYFSDSAFKYYFKGFAIDADESFGNSLMAFGLYNNPRTKLAIYYRYTKGGQDDTTVSYFQFSNTSAQHNYINRFNFSSTLAATWTPPQDDYVYLINAPGSYATIKIPGLRNLSNRVINRAELIAEQVYDPLDMTFTPPDALMLDVYDSALGTYKYVPYDFSADRQTGAINPVFGSYGKNTADGAGNPIRVWKFNITRYIQNVVTKKDSAHEFRIFTHRGINEGMFIPSVRSYDYVTSILNPRFAFGRVRLGGGNHPTQNMRLRIVYTKI